MMPRRIVLPTPIKALLPAYKLREDDLLLRIVDAFKLPLKGRDLPANVKHADRVALVTEALQIISGNVSEWPTVRDTVPFPTKIRCLSPAQAKAEFLKRWRSLQTRLVKN